MKNRIAEKVCCRMSGASWRDRRLVPVERESGNHPDHPDHPGRANNFNELTGKPTWDNGGPHRPDFLAGEQVAAIPLVGVLLEWGL